MEKELLKEIALEQNKLKESFNTGLKRKIFDEMVKYFSMPHVIVISGIRRTGKSTLLGQIIQNVYNGNGYYLNFEDERLINFGTADFNNLYEIFLELFGEKKVFFFDEIQNVPQWERFVRRMQDAGNKFFITGSNASLLSRELGTKLTGRVILTELYPFSFIEFIHFKGYKFNHEALLQTKERALLKKYFNEYLEKGGMPEYLKYNDTTALKRTYEDILYRDVAVRHEIKEVKALRELCLYFMSNITGLFTYNNLKQMLCLGSVNTVRSYINFLEDSYLIFTTNRFSYSLKQQYFAPKKVYCIDNGLIEAVAFQFSKNRGKFLENLVFIELKRRGHEVYYYKTENNLEVDFLIKDGKQIIDLIQVTENMDNDKTKQRELNALKSAMDELKMKHSLILTFDNEEQIKIEDKTITVKPVYKWLLEERTKK